MPATTPRRAPEVTPADLMEPILYRGPFTAPGWLFDMKLDGIRTLARRRGDEVALITRGGRDMSGHFPEVVGALGRIPGEWHLDAELVLPDARGRSARERLRRRSAMRAQASIEAAARAEPASLCVFDILTFGYDDLRDRSTDKRKARLRAVVPALAHVQLVWWLEGDGGAAFAKACGLELEGIVAKKLDAPYQPGKRPTWRTIRNPAYAR